MEFTVNKSKLEILDFFKLGKENSKWTDYFKNKTIDFSELEMNNGQIEIYRKPKFTSVFRPNGKITIKIIEVSDKESRLIGEIFPFYKIGRPLIIFLSLFVVIFAVVALVSSPISNSIVMITIVFLAIGIGIPFEYFNSKFALKEYLEEIIEALNVETKASR